MERDVYVKLLEKLNEVDEVIAGLGEDFSGIEETVAGLVEDVSGLGEDVSGLEQDVSGLEETVSGLQSAITVTTSSVSGNTTVAGQSYTDIFTDLPAGKYLVMVNYGSNIPIIICKGAVNTSSNVYGDVSSGGAVYLDISEATTIKMYANTNDTADVTLYRVKINAIKIG